jgi:hypothetical protein
LGANDATNPRSLSSLRRRPSNASGFSVARASVISELASCMRCPGSGLSAPVLPWPSKTTRPPRSIAESSRRPAHGQRRRPCVRPQGNLLAYQVPKRGHLYPHKGKRRARIVSPLSEETAGSLRGVPVRDNLERNPELIGFVWVLNPLIASRSPSETGFRGPAFLHSAGGDLCGLREREPRRGQVL